MKWNKDKDIFALMVGHGTQTNGVWDSGCAYGKYTEADLMLPIVKVATKMLRKSGVKVLTDADKGNNRNMISSVAWANSKKCKLYMSIHCDFAASRNDGVAPIYKTADGKAMAVAVGKKVAKLMDMKYCGAFKRTDLYETNATNMPAVIFETGCIKTNLKKLKDYKKYGKALAKAICAYIGVKYVAKTNAEKLCASADKTIKDMKKLGFKYKNAYKLCGMSWEQAKKTKKSNCATFVSYALQRIKLLKPGQIFWINGDTITYKGDGCKAQVAKIGKITHPHKKPKDAGLKKGDICGYSSPHTQIFAGWKDKKKTKPLWYSYSGADVGDAEPKVKKTYTNRKIDTIIRLK